MNPAWNSGPVDPRVEWRMLGRFKVSVDGQEVGLGSQRQQRLALALALAGPGGLTTDELAARTWDDDELPTNPPAVIRTYVSRIRKALGDDAARALVTTGHGYAFATSADSDLADFHRLTAEADRAPSAEASTELLQEALALFAGRPFSGFEDVEWVAPLLSRVSDERLSAVESLAEALVETQRFQAAAQLAEEELIEHPYQESLRGLQMLALYGANRQAAALSAYETHRARMIEDLGVDPSVELQRLHQRILEQDPELDAAATPLTVRRQNRKVILGLSVAVAAILVVALAVVRAERGQLDEANRVARSQEIMATAAGLAVSDPELSLLLAVEAQRLAPEVEPPVEVLDLLAATGNTNRVIQTFDSSIHGATRVRYADVTSDGELVFVGDHDSFSVIETSTGSALWSQDTGGEHFFRWGYLADDEDVLVILRYDSRSVLVDFGAYDGTAMNPSLTERPGRVELYETRTGELIREYPIAGACAANEIAAFRSIELASRLMAYADFDPCDEFGGYGIAVIDTETENEVYRAFTADPARFFDITLGGGRVLWYDPSRDGHLVVDLGSGEEWLISEQEGRAVLSPDGKTVAIVPAPDGAPTGSPLLYEVESGKLIDRLTGVAGQVLAIFWSADSSRVFTMGLGTLASWDVASGEQTLHITDAQGVIGFGGVSEDGEFATAYLADTDLLRVWNTGLGPPPGVTRTVVPIGAPLDTIDGSGHGLLGVKRTGEGQATIGVVGPDGFVEAAAGFAAAPLDRSVLVWQTADRLGRGPVVTGEPSGAIAATFDGICWSEHHESRPPTCRPGQDGVPGEAYDLSASPDGSYVAGTVTTATPDHVATTRLMVWSNDGSLVQEVVLDAPPRTRIAWVNNEIIATENGWLVDITDGSWVTVDLAPTAIGGEGSGSAYAGTSRGGLWSLSPGGSELVADAVHDGLIDSVDVLEDRIASFGNDGVLAVTDRVSGSVLRRIPVGPTRGTVAWVDTTTVAVAQGDQVTLFSVDPIDLATLAGELVTRTLTEPECQTHLGVSCDEWSREAERLEDG